MKMTMTMKMRAAMAGKGLVMKNRVVSKVVELVRGKKYLFTFVESGVAYHLCER